ncbi:RNA-directed RNA polymerase [ssRNA phage Esthiorhiza.2_45]|uniref:RNA-directed RNA polymerase n=2 Tax=Leviviricetes TaxID=2842243 RepID=A0A8S5L4D0_9VIRU|nr:RNA-directed RNA polymerase [ssRNA phage Esthiorhiza.2_45]QDH91261.1 MAG: RNA-dependent RNA polymerase [Leviviridae sp.]DAD52050.1 TPA_asm: RNA-directed RNA polymerase [ssRNA phage Esthiorhiza.2_45]
MKSQADSLLHVAEHALLRDIALAYPALQDGLSKDFDRLALYCRSRGLAFFTLDLPNLDSLLVEALETGRLMLNGPLSHRVSKRIKVPRLFSGLWLRVFDEDACLRQEPDVSAIFFLRQLCCLGKKIAVDCSTERLLASVEKYHDIERELRDPTFRWDSDELYGGEDPAVRHLGELCIPIAEEGGSALQEAEGCKTQSSEEPAVFDSGLCRLLDQVQQVADLISEAIGPYDPISFSDEMESSGRGLGFRHGPGAVSERLRSHEKSDFPNWPDKLQAVFPFELVGKTAGSDVDRPSNVEEPSRLISVPKTAKGPRLIASEPTSHMWCQQGIREFLVDRLRGSLGTHFVDFHDQAKSGALVLQASLDRRLATVDLSDASDRLTCWTVERIFRRNVSLLTALHAARTRYMRDDISHVPSLLKLKKFASQGTAVTFPVQSIVFLCIALGASLDGDISWQAIRRLRGQVRVFGDDIIIPRHGYERLVRIMDALQLKVNKAKSFVNGHFRESCGVDGYRGYDVTPVKPKTLVADSPASCQAVVDTSNNLFNKGLWYASDSLGSLLPARLRRAIRIVGANDAGYSGLTSYSGSYEHHLAKRWNSRLHRYEVRVWQLSVRTRERPREGWSTLLDFFASKHSHEHARTVSSSVDTRKTIAGLSWEPCSPHA